VRPYLDKTLHKKGLVEWLRVKALSSSPSNGKKKRKKERKKMDQLSESQSSEGFFQGIPLRTFAGLKGGRVSFLDS
jgi:hypothetical protein